MRNQSEYDAKGISLGVGFNAGKNDSQGQKQPETVISKPNKIDGHASSQVGVSKSIGFGLDSDKAKSTTQSGINSSNLTIRETVRQEELTGKTAEQIKSEILTDVTTDTARENSGALNNVFDKDKVQKEINLQMDVTKKFDANRQEAKAEINKQIDELKAAGKDASQWQKAGVLLDMVSAGLSAPTASGAGIAASTLSPAVSYEIGQYFKGKDAEGSAAHILAHTILGAAVAATGGNNALSVGIAAGGAEAAAPLLAEYLYGKKAKDLTASEKSTISSIVGLAGTAVGATTGDVSNTVQGGQSAQNAVENNYLTYKEALSREQTKAKLAQCNQSKKCNSAEISQLELSLQLLERKDQVTDAKIIEVCGSNPTSLGCQQLKAQLKDAAASFYFKQTDPQYKDALTQEQKQNLGLLTNLPKHSLLPADHTQGNGFINDVAPNVLTGAEFLSGAGLGRIAGGAIGALVGSGQDGDIKGAVIGGALGVLGGTKVPKGGTTTGAEALNLVEANVSSKFTGKTSNSYSEKSIFNKYPNYTELKFNSLDEQAKFLSNSIEGLSVNQAKIILETGVNKNTSIVLGGSRIRGDNTINSDIDVGFGSLNSNQGWKAIKQIQSKSNKLEGALKLEETRITPGNSTKSIPLIKSPEEFFQRNGIRGVNDSKAGQVYLGSGSISVFPDGRIEIMPPNYKGN